MTDYRRVIEAMRNSGWVMWQSPPEGHRWALVKDADGVERYRAVPIKRNAP